MPQRVTATAAALDLLERLRVQHGDLIVHVSGGCCDGSSPMCLRAADLPASPHDVQLGALTGVPVVIDGDQDRRWQHPSFHLDVAPGAAGGFSLEALEDLHFTAASGDLLPSPTKREGAMKAAVVHDFTQPLSIENVAMPEPGDGQVLVRIEACGLCHTDIHAAHGDWPIKPDLPLIPGHEGVGIVEALGPGAGEQISVGDRVAIPWLGFACGHCRYCNSGRETLCEAQINTGYGMDGGYAEYVAAYEQHIVKVPDGVDSLDAAPLSCAGVTVYKAVKSSEVGPSQLCAIFGVGGLGHLAVQYAKIQGATVVAVDLEDDKLEMAKDLGADYVVNAAEQDPATEIQKLGGADAAIALAVSHKPFEQAFDSLARGGTLMMVALPPDNYVKLPIFETVLRGINIKGSIVGTHRDVEDVFKLHTLGRTRVLRETRPLEEVNEAFDDVEHARNKEPRVVLTV